MNTKLLLKHTIMSFIFILLFCIGNTVKGAEESGISVRGMQSGQALKTIYFDSTKSHILNVSRFLQFSCI